jgi:uncharacterized protein
MQPLLQSLREYVQEHGIVESKVIEGKQDEGEKFADYFDYSETIGTVPSHRALALLRGRREGILDVTLRLDTEAEKPKWDAPHNPCEGRIAARFGIRNQGRPADKWLADTARWTWRVKSFMHLETELMGALRERSELDAINVFATNLKALLLAAPAGQRATMGLDPGLRTGVKVAVVDATGKVVDTAVIYPHQPKNDWDGSLHTLGRLAAKHNVSLISIGNGTASRETDKLAQDLIKQHPEQKMTKIVVSEAGASVYSASEFASRELPDMDVSLRGAVSIARRLQDPLAELVKIDPKSIGVGQYQHDVSQTQLARSLDAVVEDCVNAVGVDVNTASAPLLARVSGLSPRWRRHRVLPRRQGRVHLARGAEIGAAPGRQDLRTGGRLPARDGRRQSAGRLGGAPGIVSAGGKDPGDIKKDIKAVIGETALIKTLNPAKYADDKFGVPTIHRHPEGTGKAGPRSASGIHHRHLQGRRGRDPRPASGHDPGRRGDQRGGVRRVCRHRRAPGRPGAHLGAVEHLRQGPAHGGQGRPGGQGQGAGSGREAQAHRADHAPDRQRAASRAQPQQRGDRNDRKSMGQHQKQAARSEPIGGSMAAAFAKLRG